MALINIDVDKAAQIVSDKIGALLDQALAKSEERLAALAMQAETQALATAQQVAKDAIEQAMTAFRAEMEEWRKEVAEMATQWEFKAGLVRK